MGSFCGCCSRNQSSKTNTTKISTHDEETQAMLKTMDSPIALSKMGDVEGDQKTTSPSKSQSQSPYGSTDTIQFRVLQNAPIIKTQQRSASHKKPSSLPNIDTNPSIKAAPNFSPPPPPRPKDEGIPINTTNLVIAGAGFDEINGEFRWFLHSSKWCLFREDVSYSIENGVSVQEVYTQLAKLNSSESSFRWPESVELCWIMSTMDTNAIYYAAPQLNDEYIPTQKDAWISVHGSLPAPEIYPNLIDSSVPPDQDEHFGNVSPSNSASSSRSSLSQYKRSASSVSSLKPIEETITESEPMIQKKVIETPKKKEEADEEEEESLSDLD